jgi:hypothetical protein
MNQDYEKQLAAEIDRELKALPELSAPRGLAARVMATIAQRATLPWYRRAWQTWPIALQTGALAFLLILLGATGFGFWELSQSPALSLGLQKLAVGLSPLFALFSALNALGTVLVLAVKQISTGLLLALVGSVALAWAACVGLGTVYVRLAFARR